MKHVAPTQDQVQYGREPFPIPLRWYLLLTTALTGALAFEWWMSLRPPWQTPQPFLKLFYICATTNFVWAGIAILAWLLVLRFPIMRPHLVRDLAAHAGMTVFVVAVHGLRYEAVTWSNSAPNQFDYREFVSILDYFLRAEAITYATIYLAVAWWLRALWLGRKADREALRAARLQSDLDNARLRILQGQLEPHFLFNALNCVSGLMHTDPDAADLMLERIAGLLRKSLEMGSAERTSLLEEIAFCREYLEVQRSRFHDRLQYVLDVAPELLHFSVPALILQPLVENAVVHGGVRRGEQTHVVVAADHRAGALWLTVRNNARNLGESFQPRLGLTNVRNRLRLLYGKAAGMKIERTSEEFSAELMIPDQPFPVRPT
jgi:two-component system, LytTR family, sensor kinase